MTDSFCADPQQWAAQLFGQAALGDQRRTRRLVQIRYERASTLLTSNRPVEDWDKLLGDTAATSALLDRLLHHAHVLSCGPRSYRTQLQSNLPKPEATR